MRRKMFISIVLIIAILLQSVVPLLTVNASTTYKITLTDNSELYTAIKNSLTDQGIEATYSSSTNTITITSDEFEGITYLDLSNSEIDDLTGLSQFTNVTSINLTANELTADSNLSELDSLPLEKLNLSSNKLESVSSITTFSSIAETDITNQEVTTKAIISVDISDDSDQVTTYTVTLPDILLEDTGEIDADWIDSEVDGNAYVNWQTVNGNEVTLTVASGTGDDYTALTGLITITINVEDSTSKLANTKMSLYYVITDSDHTGIIFEDENLYNAVKSQLTAGQTENDELESYGSSGETLYTNAYDVCLIMTIENNTLFNKIPSLILNDKKIKDLTGLEEFVGLDSELNLSYNYIDSIERLIELDENKDTREVELQEKYSEYLSILSEYLSTYKSLEEEYESLEEEYENLVKELAKLESADNPSESDIASKEEEITECLLNMQACEDDMDLYYTYISATMIKLYNTYENEYLLTGIIPSEIATLSYSEIYASTKSTLSSYASSIISYVSNLEQDGGLTDWEAQILIDYFDIPTETTVTETVEDEDGNSYEVESTKEIEDPISTYFSDWLEGSSLYSKSDYYNLVYAMCMINEVVIAGNQCQLEQIYNDQSSCSYEDAFDILVSDLYSICLDTSLASRAANYYSTYSTTCMSDSEETDQNKIIAIATKLVNASSDVDTFVKLPRLKSLNLTDNSIESLEGIEVFEELITLNAYKNLLDDINDVDWSAFTVLEYLNLGYNQLSDVECLEVIDSLVTLNLSNNLISGNFDFYLAGMGSLESADFSNNQISNIAYYVNQFKFLAKAADMDVNDYLLSDYCPTVSFQYQTLSMSTTVVLDGSFITIDLPSIFEQAEDIDNTRTSFGIDSLLGTVSSDGTTVKLYTPSTGTRTAIVTIEGESGSGSSTDGIAYGTTCTIEYTIVEEEDEEEETTDDDTETEDDTTETDDDDTSDDTTTDDDTTTTDDDTSTDDDTTETDDTSTDAEVVYIIDGEYLIVLSSKTTVDNFVESVSEQSGYTVKVTDNDSASGNYVATGSMASFYTDSGENYSYYEIIILGDVDGNGLVNTSDSAIIRNVINDTVSLSDTFAMAADVNGDGDIDKLDYVLVLQFRAEVISTFETYYES